MSLNLHNKTQHLMDLISEITHELDHEKTLELITQGVRRITNSDGATLYILKNNKYLEYKIMVNKTLKMFIGGTTKLPIPFEAIPIYLHEDTEYGTEENLFHICSYSALKKKTIVVDDIYHDQHFNHQGAFKFDKDTGYTTKSLLTIPLKNVDDNVLGVLQLINPKSETGSDRLFSKDDIRFAEFLASQATLSLANQTLIEEQRQLFNAFVDVLATAIDDKSPYTGGHCTRVPDIAMLIAEAAHEANWGIFQNFNMTEKDRYEIKLAALLHDCGKVTTPVHIQDKSTKLETIFDRIELIDTRFEILKRDAEIATLKDKLKSLRESEGLLSHFEKSKELDEKFEEKVLAFNSDRAFLRHTNMGVEFMEEDKKVRVHEISKYQWKNQFETVSDFLSPDEIKNLNITKGTLTDEERQIINHHIVITQKMLNRLPYPKHLERIPEYAGNHHERMDGKGYPNGLTRDQMSLPSRMMGIADIFEALTAKDRPYKKGKMLSEVLRILGFMKLEGHIDPDIFELFVSEKIYAVYAEKYMDPEQVDLIDESKIPGYTPVEEEKKAA